MVLRVLSGVSLFFVVCLLAVTRADALPFSTVMMRSTDGAVTPLTQKVDWIAAIKRQKQAVRKKLNGKGYSDVKVQFHGKRGYSAKACRRGRRFLVKLDQRQRIQGRERIGRCRDGGRDAEDWPRGNGGLARARDELRGRGYRDIRFVDRTLPVYVAMACKRGRRYRLRLNRRAIILGRVDVGRCHGVERPVVDDQPRPRRQGGKRPAEIRRLLRERGFERIIFTDRQLPVYVVRACKGNRRMELRLNRFGEIRDRERIGRCEVMDEGMRPPQVRRVLQTRGFSRIIFTDHQLPVYVVEACRYDRKYELRLNRFARVMRRTEIGPCRERHVRHEYGPGEVADILRRRGYEEIDFFDRDLPGYGVTACKRGQKFRLRINRFAEVRARRRTGFCRPPRVAPPIVSDYEEIDDAEIDGTSRIDPETCQNYLDALVHRNRIHFDFDSAIIRRGSYGLLRRLARVMRRCPDSRIEIAGHTDSDGSREYNHHLSHERAHAVARFLFREGISRRRITAMGYGEDQPLIPYERTERDKARNRRIEFTVIWGDDDMR